MQINGARKGDGSLPIEAEAIDFQVALDQARSTNDECHLLVGNGFSIGAHTDFRYPSLYGVAEQYLSARIKGLFCRYGTSDFERVLRQLDEGRWIAGHYEVGDAEQSKIAEDYDSLKLALISAIETVHPARGRDVADSDLRPTVDFLKQFRSLFTTNYDLLLYWAMLSRRTDSGGYYFQDGFGLTQQDGQGPLVFLGRCECDKRFVHYLHGALHLTTTEAGQVQKLRWEDSNSNIMAAVRQNLQHRQYPLVVSEGTSSHKLRRIRSSGYLSWNFDRFREISGHLFTYGSALADPDDHLWEAVAGNDKLKSVWVGIYGYAEPDEKQQLIARSEKLRIDRQGQSLDVRFYKSESAGVWGSSST